MFSRISELLRARGIELAAPISLADCHITRPYLLAREGISDGTAVMLAVPYYTTECDNPARNISAYAVSRDYHLFFKELFDEILPILRAEFPGHRFAGFADHSPIAEAQAAVAAGLGFFGCNHLFLTKPYSSFVFLGEIITDAPCAGGAKEPSFCPDCGACRHACPVGLDVTRCVSALTQKKGALNADEEAAVLAHGFAWGCDRCQDGCPITAAAKACGSIYSPIPFFAKQAIAHLTAEAVRTMSEEEFAARAYSWRGRDVILRNLDLLTKGAAE